MGEILWEETGPKARLKATVARYETAMRAALRLAENWKATSASKVKDYGDAREEACSGGNYDDAFSGGYDLGAATMKGECATEMLFVLAALSDQPAEEPAESKLEAAARRSECVGCGRVTHYGCPFCTSYDRIIVPLCEQPECREKHESSGTGCARTRPATLDAQPRTPEPKGEI